MCAVIVFAAAAAAAASLSRYACLCVSHVASVSFLVRLHPSKSVTTSTNTFSTRSSLPLSRQPLAAPGGLLRQSLMSHTHNRLHHEPSEPTTRDAAIGSDPLADATGISRTTAVAGRPHAAALKKLLVTSAPTRFIGREVEAATAVRERRTVEAAGLPGTGTEAVAVRFAGLGTVEARPPTTQRPPPATGLPINRQQPAGAGAHTTGVRRRTGGGVSKTAVKDRTESEAGSPAEGAAPGWTVAACCRGPVAAEATEAGAAAPAPAQGLAAALGKAAAPATSRAAAQKTAVASSYNVTWIHNKKEDRMDGETIQPVKAAEPPVIGTHSGTFHADEVLATVMLLSLPEYKDAKLLRSRDPAALAVCNVVVDVGAEYCVATRRFDHHQKSFTSTFYDDENQQDAAAAEVPAAATAAAAGATTGGEREAAGQGAPDTEGERRTNTLGDTRREERIVRAKHPHETKDIDKETRRARQDGDAGSENVQPAAGRTAGAAEKERKKHKSEEKTGEGNLASLENGKGETAPAAAAQPRAVTKLSSAGLIYKHFGKRVLQHRYGICDEDRLETVYQRLYRTFVEAVDAIDNGVSVVPGGGRLAYRDTTNLSSRIGNCNPPWNYEFLRQKYPDDPLYNPEKTSLYPVEIQGGDPDGNAGFRKAMQLAAEALDAAARGIVDVWLPARDIVTAAVRERYTVHPSSRIIRLKQWCPFEDHVFLLEKEMNVKPPLLYCVYPDRKGGKEVGWRIRAIGIEGHMLESRLPLSSRFRGLRGSELGSVVCRACKEELVNVNIKSDEFIHCHATGFIAGTTTLDAAIALGALTIEEAASAGSLPS